MHLYAELWNPRQAWLDLSGEERSSYLEKVGPGIGKLTEAGIELVGFAICEDDTPHEAGYRYLAVWKMPKGREHAHLLEGILDEAGWHDYFDQVNARGAVVPPPQALQDMAQLR